MFRKKKSLSVSTANPDYSNVLLFKVESVKATVNTTPPKIYDHILVKRKKKMVRDMINYLILHNYP